MTPPKRSASTAAKKPSAATRQPIRAIIANYGSYVRRTIGIHRLEPGDEPDHHSAAISAPGAAIVRRLDQVRRRDTVGAAFGTIQDGLSFFRNAYDNSPATTPRSSVCTAWSRPTSEGRALPKLTHTPGVTARLNSTVSRCARPMAAADRPAGSAAGAGETMVGHRVVWSGQDHAAAQPRAAVAVPRER